VSVGGIGVDVAKAGVTVDKIGVVVGVENATGVRRNAGEATVRIRLRSLPCIRPVKLHPTDNNKMAAISQPPGLIRLIVFLSFTVP